MRPEAGAFSTAYGHACCEVFAVGSRASDALMARRCLTLHYYSTKEDSCEARRSFRKSATPCQPFVFTACLRLLCRQGPNSGKYIPGPSWRKEHKCALSRPAHNPK